MKKVTIIIFYLAIAYTLLSGTMKLIGGDDIIERLKSSQIEHLRIPLGVSQLLFISLFAIPSTFRIGFLLISCYYAGAIAVEIVNQQSLNALLPIVLIWMAAFLKDRTMFFVPSNKIYKTI